MTCAMLPSTRLYIAVIWVHMQLLQSRKGYANVKNFIGDAWNDAGGHDLLSELHMHFLPTTEPSLESSKLIPSSGNPHFQCLHFEIVIRHDATKITTFFGNWKIERF